LDGLAPQGVPEGPPRSRIFLVALRGQHAAPMAGENPLYRTRVLIVAAGSEARFAPQDQVIGPLPQAEASPAAPLTDGAGTALQARLIRGELLCDAANRLYERLGERLRPVERLVTGSQGELIDLVAAGGGGAAPGATKNGRRKSGKEQLPAIPDRRETALEIVRRLAPAPGVRRVVCWGDFKEQLAPRIAQPALLRDAHQLACHVQVYESLIEQTLGALAAAALGDAARAGELRVLTPAHAQKLGLAELLRRDRVPRPDVARGADPLPAGTLVFQLAPESDPTASADPRPAPPTLGGRRTAIPEQFLKPWEFQRSREEVLYDMLVRQRFAGLASRFFRKLLLLLTGSGEFQRWQMLLFGRTPDDQLWAVRPPAGAFAYRPLRQWAHETLRLAGYDPDLMLVEWEIYWRRKGL